MKKLITKVIVTALMTLSAIGLDKVAMEVFNANVNRHVAEYGGQEGYMKAHPILGVIFLIIFPLLLFIVLPCILLAKLIYSVCELIDKRFDKHIEMETKEDKEWDC